MTCCLLRLLLFTMVSVQIQVQIVEKLFCHQYQTEFTSVLKNIAIIYLNINNYGIPIYTNKNRLVTINKIFPQKNDPNTVISHTDDKTQKQFNILNFDVIGDGINDDTRAFQNAIDAAILAKGKLIIPSPSNFYKITDKLNIIPVNGQNEVYLDIIAQSGSRDQIVYSGASNKSVFYIKGLRFSIFSGLKVRIDNGIQNTQIFDLDTDNLSSSTTHLTFKNCVATLGNGLHNVGYRLGHISGGNGDISNIQWENCSVWGGTRIPTLGQIGWLIEGSNTLQNTWMGGFGAFLDKMFSNVSRLGASGTGNGAVYFYGVGASQNNLDYEINNMQTYLISGGRYESGKRFINVTNGVDAPSVTLTGVEIDDYHPNDGILFYLDRPCSLVLQNVNITKGKQQSSYTSAMIKCYGGGEGSGKGTLMIEGGSIEASDPFYSVNNNRTEWSVYVRGVGKLMNGVRAQRMTDLPTSSNSVIPLLVAQRNSNLIRKGGFEVVPLPVVVIDNKSAWDEKNNWYVIPESGTYKIIMKYRLSDRSVPNLSHAIGAGRNQTEASDATLLWGYTPGPGSIGAYRHGIINEKVANFSSGDHVMLYSYISVASINIISAEMIIERIR